jgi:hypothetical protein
MEFKTRAEQNADAARELPALKAFALAGVRAQVAVLLSMIGREGIFSTYSVHDIRSGLINETAVRMWDSGRALE